MFEIFSELAGQVLKHNPLFCLVGATREQGPFDKAIAASASEKNLAKVGLR